MSESQECNSNTTKIKGENQTQCTQLVGGLKFIHIKCSSVSVIFSGIVGIIML